LFINYIIDIILLLSTPNSYIMTNFMNECRYHYKKDKTASIRMKDDRKNEIYRYSTSEGFKT